MLGLICFFIDERVRFSNVEALLAKKHAKMSKYVSYDFIIRFEPRMTRLFAWGYGAAGTKKRENLRRWRNLSFSYRLCVSWEDPRSKGGTVDLHALAKRRCGSAASYLRLRRSICHRLRRSRSTFVTDGACWLRDVALPWYVLGIGASVHDRLAAGRPIKSIKRAMLP